MGWNIMLRGAQPLSEEQESKKPPNPLPKLMSNLLYDIIYSSQIFLEAAFAGIIESFEENEAEWTKWVNCSDPHLEKLPMEWEEKLSDFQKIILLKVFRPEKMMFSFQKYVIDHMGQFFVESQSATMDVVYKDTSSYTPLIFVLSTGADPTA